MGYKYKTEIEKLKLIGCPPENYKPQNLQAFRFVYSDINHPNNFLPVGKISPERTNDFDTENQCKSYGLSMFVDKSKAQLRFISLLKRTKGRYATTVGSSIAIINLSENDGKCSDWRDDFYSHFTFHEFDKTDLKNKVESIFPLNFK